MAFLMMQDENTERFVSYCCSQAAAFPNVSNCRAFYILYQWAAAIDDMLPTSKSELLPSGASSSITVKY